MKYVLAYTLAEFAAGLCAGLFYWFVESSNKAINGEPDDKRDRDRLVNGTNDSYN